MEDFNEELTALGIAPEDKNKLGTTVHSMNNSNDEFAEEMAALGLSSADTQTSTAQDVQDAQQSNLSGFIDTWKEGYASIKRNPNIILDTIERGVFPNRTEYDPNKPLSENLIAHAGNIAKGAANLPFILPEFATGVARRMVGEPLEKLIAGDAGVKGTAKDVGYAAVQEAKGFIDTIKMAIPLVNQNKWQEIFTHPEMVYFGAKMVQSVGSGVNKLTRANEINKGLAEQSVAKGDVAAAQDHLKRITESQPEVIRESAIALTKEAEDIVAKVKTPEQKQDAIDTVMPKSLEDTLKLNAKGRQNEINALMPNETPEKIADVQQSLAPVESKLDETLRLVEEIKQFGKDIGWTPDRNGKLQVPVDIKPGDITILEHEIKVQKVQTKIEELKKLRDTAEKATGMNLRSMYDKAIDDALSTLPDTEKIILKAENEALLLERDKNTEEKLTQLGVSEYLKDTAPIGTEGKTKADLKQLVIDGKTEEAKKIIEANKNVEVKPEIKPKVTKESKSVITQEDKIKLTDIVNKPEIDINDLNWLKENKDKFTGKAKTITEELITKNEVKGEAPLAKADTRMAELDKLSDDELIDAGIAAGVEKRIIDRIKLKVGDRTYVERMIAEAELNPDAEYKKSEAKEKLTEKELKGGVDETLPDIIESEFITEEEINQKLGLGEKKSESVTKSKEDLKGENALKKMGIEVPTKTEVGAAPKAKPELRTEYDKLMGKSLLTRRQIDRISQIKDDLNLNPDEVSELRRKVFKSRKENGLISEARHQKNVDYMDSAKNNLNTFDPKYAQALIENGVYHIERGVKDFYQWSKDRVEEFGEQIRPYLHDAWIKAQKQMEGFKTQSKEPFYSKTQRFINANWPGVRPLTQAEGLKLVEGWKKKGSINAEEVPGLEEFVKGNDKLTKAEVSEFMEKNLVKSVPIINDLAYEKSLSNIKAYFKGEKPYGETEYLGMGATPHPELVKDAATVMKYHIEGLVKKGIAKSEHYFQASQEMVKEYGEKVRPYLKPAWDAVQEIKEIESGKVQAPKSFSTKVAEKLGIKKEETGTNPDMHELGEKFSKPIDKRETVGDFIRDALGVVSTELKIIHPEIMNRTRKWAMDLGTNLTEGMTESAKFIKGFNKIPEKEQLQLNYFLRNRDFDSARELLSEYKLVGEFDKTIKVLDNIWSRYKQRGGKVKETENYWPTLVRDYQGLMNFLGKETKGQIEEAISNIEKSTGEILSSQERGIVVDKLLRGFAQGRINLSDPRYAKARTIHTYAPGMVKFMAPAHEALVDYIHNMNRIIEARNFFGKESIEDSIANKTLKKMGIDMDAFLLTKGDLSNSIGNLVVKLKDEGLIKSDADMFRLKELLYTIFNPSRTSNWVASAQNMTYGATLGNFGSAITQIGDMALAAEKAGYYQANKAAVKSLVGKSEVSLEQLGFSDIHRELMQGPAAYAINTLMKIVGFNKIERTTSEAAVNGALEKYRGLAKNDPSKLLGTLKRDYGFNEKESGELISDLKGKKITDGVKLLLFNVLSDIKPMSSLEMPKKYLESNKGKLFYTLKRYQIKLIDTYRRDIFQEIKSGDRVEGIKRLVRLTTALALAGTATDELKDLLYNREFDLTDTAVNNIWKIFGLTRYTPVQIKREGISGALINIAKPASLGVVSDIGKDVLTSYDDLIGDNESDKGYELPKFFPVLGKFYYYQAGEGRRREERRREREEE